MALSRFNRHAASVLRPFAALAAMLAAGAYVAPAGADQCPPAPNGSNYPTDPEPASCQSSNPSDWPAPSKPYFMIVVDTSGSMGEPIATACNAGGGCPPSQTCCLTPGTPAACTSQILNQCLPPTCSKDSDCSGASGYPSCTVENGQKPNQGTCFLPTNSCGYPGNKAGNARCAVQKTVTAFAGEVNFGLAGYSWQLTGCPAGPCQACNSNNSDANGQAPECFDGCKTTYSLNSINSCDPTFGECGAPVAEPNPAFNPALNAGQPCAGPGTCTYAGTSTINSGANILVPLVQDAYWQATPNPSNVQQILNFVDNDCGNGELGAADDTPIGGVLFDMYRYFSGTFLQQYYGIGPAPAACSNTVPCTAPAVCYPYLPPGSGLTCAKANNGAGFCATPLPSPLGTKAEGERGCRSVNVIYITDGEETCNNYNLAAYPTGEGLGVFEAGQLFNPGVSFGGQTWPIRTYMIGLSCPVCAGEIAQKPLNNIANAGGTNTAIIAQTDASLATALANIISGAIPPEVCDNADNNCNGCTDEGFAHYCNVSQTCCNLAPATCLANYQASITPAAPNGDVTQLPCTTVTQSQTPANWLCYNPGDVCDGIDNNCNCAVDENDLKCGNPLHCPETEVCNGVDDNCNGKVDEGGVCGDAGTCTHTPVACDGCDHNCDGIVNEGLVATTPCGPMGPGEPAWCQGVISCNCANEKLPNGDPVGSCLPNCGFSTCSNAPKTEACNGIDDDCDSIVDEDIPSVPCVPAGTPANQFYNGASPANCDPARGHCGDAKSTCSMGHTTCTGGASVCVGYVGPSAEVCDGLDNDCDGTVDDGVLPGVGNACGVKQPPCTPGVTACVNGALVCQGGNQAQPEVCDGIDNDCDGMIDEAPLADAPQPGQNGCWDLPPGSCATPCTFKGADNTLSWCPPPGASCYSDEAPDGGPGLLPPCQQGSIVCRGTWVCTQSVDPQPESCNGVDDECNGQVDQGNPGGGLVCGSNVGACKQGVTDCENGMIVCLGAIGPSPETCNGIDDDCDGTIDEDVGSMGPCQPTYDMVAYPGQRDFSGMNGAPCHDGHLVCDPTTMGMFVCKGGQGPAPELCDGIDNDCDDKIDEAVAPPDGINGTANPNPPPAGNIGGPCGNNQGECAGGEYACFHGTFVCLGGKAPGVETCNCLDDNCDGLVDNQVQGAPPICGSNPDEQCVTYMGQCECSLPCNPGEFACPLGQLCVKVPQSGMPGNVSFRCVINPDAACNGNGDCSTVTSTDATGKVTCAPAGSMEPNCIVPPVCTCKGPSGCQDPCFQVSCMPGQVCAQIGQFAGKCVTDSCFDAPCQGCGQVCANGSCMMGPCSKTSCPTGDECIPSADFKTFTCAKSCATKTCGAGDVCVNGTCEKTCSPACSASETCDMTQTPPVCAPNKCIVDGGMGNPCNNAACCNPLTGICGDCPCEGVLCPTGQVCTNTTGQCEVQMMGSGGAGGGGTTSTSTTSAVTSTAAGPTSATGSGGGSTGSGNGGNPNAIWGLATGGGGCACELGPLASVAGRAADGRFLLFAAAIAVAHRRRKRRLEDERRDGAASGPKPQTRAEKEVAS